MGTFDILFRVLILLRINYLTGTTSSVGFMKVQWENLIMLKACLHYFLLIIFI